MLCNKRQSVPVVWDPFQDFFPALGQWPEVSWRAPLDVYEEDERYVVRAELPGIAAEQLKITLRDNVLSIRGERKHERKVAKEGSVQHQEIAYGRVERSVRLPQGADAARAEASYRDGILEIILPKREDAKPRAIDIKVKR